RRRAARPGMTRRATLGSFARSLPNHLKTLATPRTTRRTPARPARANRDGRPAARRVRSFDRAGPLRRRRAAPLRLPAARVAIGGSGPVTEALDDRPRRIARDELDERAGGRRVDEEQSLLLDRRVQCRGDEPMGSADAVVGDELRIRDEAELGRARMDEPERLPDILAENELAFERIEHALRGEHVARGRAVRRERRIRDREMAEPAVLENL